LNLIINSFVYKKYLKMSGLRYPFTPGRYQV
jgi:hypothetical protein